MKLFLFILNLITMYVSVIFCALLLNGLLESIPFIVFISSFSIALTWILKGNIFNN